ncbi:MAG: ceramidase domain-containing protein [Proteobacteria bacterium]|nr:ceramidase domain-containing protein [Pseudomonadota bacterium]
MFLPNSCPWGSFEPASIEFCERRLCQWVVEPANTWSNIAFVIAGICILIDNKNRNRGVLNLIGWIAIVVGIGSAMFHATGTRVGEILDVSAMYLISSLFLIFYLKRIYLLSVNKLLLIYVALSGTAIMALVMSRSNGILVFASHITVCVLFEIMIRRARTSVVDYRYLRLLVAGFVVSFTAWGLDIRHVICNPDNHILGGHAIWHLANATCLWSYYKFQEQFFPAKI